MPTTNIYNNTNIQQEHSPIEIKSVFGQGTTGVGSFNGRQGDVIVLQSDITNALGYVPQSNTAEQVRVDFTFTGTPPPVGAGNEIITIAASTNTRPAQATTPFYTISWTGVNFYFWADGVRVILPLGDGTNSTVSFSLPNEVAGFTSSVQASGLVTKFSASVPGIYNITSTGTNSIRFTPVNQNGFSVGTATASQTMASFQNQAGTITFSTGSTLGAYTALTLSQPAYSQDGTVYPAMSVTYQTVATDSERSIPSGLWNLVSPLRPLWTVDSINPAVLVIDTNSGGALPDVLLQTSGTFASGAVNLSITQGGAPNDVITFTDPINGNTWQYTTAQGETLGDTVGNIAFLEELSAYYLQLAAVSDSQGYILRATRFMPGALAANQILNVNVVNGSGSDLEVVRRVLSAGA